MSTAAAALQPQDERSLVLALIKRILRECPERAPTSEGERQAQAIVRREFESMGLGDLALHEQSFTFNENLYANLALTFGIGTAGTVVSGVAPLAGLALHLLAGTSFLADSARRGYILRRLFPFKRSQNLIATLPAKGKPRLRIVLAAHADAAFTGLMFSPKLANNILKVPGRALAIATGSQFILAGFDLLRVIFGPLALPLRPLELAISLPSLLAFALNLEIAVRHELVPGANDNLSAVAMLPALAARLRHFRPDVELVFAVTGCEEASMGGSDALAKEAGWERDRTVVIALDSMANGELRYLAFEGDVVRDHVPAWLRRVVAEVAATDPRFGPVAPFEPSVGGTDAQPFLARGYDALGLVGLDPKLGTPRHYHVPDDTAENLDMQQLMVSIDFVDALVRAVAEHRLGAAAARAAA